jgi:hypothetical protein
MRYQTDISHFNQRMVKTITGVSVMPNGNGTHGYANTENFDTRREVKERPSKNEFKQKESMNKKSK